MPDLTYSPSPPAVPGWWWLLTAAGGEELIRVERRGSGTGLWVCVQGDWIPVKGIEPALWAGPQQTPGLDPPAPVAAHPSHPRGTADPAAMARAAREAGLFEIAEWFDALHRHGGPRTTTPA
ncbi:MAG TPA: hypothetical protein VEI97_14430 [bacterium]|nr:hypothetical protein [bacterium]